MYKSCEMEEMAMKEVVIGIEAIFISIKELKLSAKWYEGILYLRFRRRGRCHESR